MRFLIDNALSQALSEGLKAAGHESVHVRDYGIQRADDSVVFDRAAAESRVLVSADTDFGTLHALRRSNAPSAILIRHPFRHPLAQRDLILANLASVEADLEAGSLVVIEPGRIRVRRLPIGGEEA